MLASELGLVIATVSPGPVMVQVNVVELNPLLTSVPYAVTW